MRVLVARDADGEGFSLGGAGQEGAELVLTPSSTTASMARGTKGSGQRQRLDGDGALAGERVAARRKASAPRRCRRQRSSHHGLFAHHHDPGSCRDAPSCRRGVRPQTSSSPAQVSEMTFRNVRASDERVRHRLEGEGAGLRLVDTVVVGHAEATVALQIAGNRLQMSSMRPWTPCIIMIEIHEHRNDELLSDGCPAAPPSSLLGSCSSPSGTSS